jgi:hypothetical protein
VSSTAPNAAIALQNVRGAVVKNNAIALTDMGVAAAAPVYSGLFYQGVMPANGGITSDYNVFYTPDGSGGTYSRFIETLSNGTNLDLGTKLDYETLGQWVAWTNADKNSVSGNFLADMEYLGSAPNQKLRVRTNLAPLGSLLNNRGQIISTVAADIDSETRGAAGQKYDIGHDEFTGRLYLSDVEAIRVTSPVAYRAGTGFFSDAEYIMTTAPIEVKGLIRNSGNLPQNSIACTLNIYRELPNGLYATVPELTKIVIVAAQSGEFMDVAFGLADGIAPDFKPKTFGELRAAGEPYVPISEFTSMLPNVTPKYKIVIGIQADQFNQNNYMEKIVRFYIRKSDMRIVASVENSMVNLDINSTTDEIAGRLNADTLFKGFGKLGWKIDQANNRFDYDIFDRRGWEQKAVNYDMYRSLWWGDGNDKSLTRFQKGDLYDFLSMGNEIEKRNLIIGSQEMVRSNNDAYLTGEILRSTNVAPGNPMGVGGDNGNNSLMGVALHRNLVQDIDNTQYTGDAFSQAGLVAVSATGEGLARPTQYYVNNNQSMTNPVAGVATSTLSRNVIYMGVDWRHFAKIEYIVRASIDFIEKNGGTIIPVELTDFDARAIGQRVELNWRTASEYKSEKFEIERTVKSEAGMGIFTKISEMKAAGTSAMPLTYGPVVDRDVVLGQTYVYRLKMVDLDGNFDYSETREVKVGGEDAAWLGEAVPNPVVNEASIEFSANGSTVVELYDITGKLVNVLYNASANGFNKITINASQLTSGRYNVILKTADVTITKTINIVK